MSDNQRIEVFFDGDCPICSREIAMIRKLDRNQQIACTNIASRDFQANAHGLNNDSVNREIHGKLADGSVIKGVEVFRQIYERLGFQRCVRWSRLPWIAKVLDYGYRVFAKHRKLLSVPFRWLK
jgi:predicted DCC family thiol-disulfide oxidoreductase YuxK